MKHFEVSDHTNTVCVSLGHLFYYVFFPVSDRAKSGCPGPSFTYISLPADMSATVSDLYFVLVPTPMSTPFLLIKQLAVRFSRLLCNY